MHSIKLEKVSKKYDHTHVIENLDLDIIRGERLVLLGPSGSGKSTILRMIAGLEDISEGVLRIDGRDVTHLPSGERNLSMVFQNYALYPHMTVKENITFGLKANKVPASEIEIRLTEALTILELQPYKERLPKDLSGGQRQRVALARAIVKQSPYFLLDEPLSNLDVMLRLHARKELVKIHELYQQTFIYVTHDQVEAMTIAHRIVLLKNGQIQMVDTPKEVYQNPVNVFTAQFIGSPSMNILSVRIDGQELLIKGQALTLNNSWSNHLTTHAHSHLLWGFRPEHANLSQSPEPNSLEATVKYTELYGDNYGITVSLADTDLTILDKHDHWVIGQSVYLTFDQDKFNFFDTETELTLGKPHKLLKG